MIDPDLPHMDARLLDLQAGIVASLQIADTLQLPLIGLHLDSARCELIDIIGKCLPGVDFGPGDQKLA